MSLCNALTVVSSPNVVVMSCGVPLVRSVSRFVWESVVNSLNLFNNSISFLYIFFFLLFFFLFDFILLFRHALPCRTCRPKTRIILLCCSCNNFLKNFSKYMFYIASYNKKWLVITL